MNFEYFFKTKPTVFLTGKFYSVMVPVTRKSLMYVKTREHKYYDATNGILKTSGYVHCVRVPQEVLDKAGEYVICVREMIERKPYFSDTGELFEFKFKFHPVKSGDITAYHIADTHNLIDEAAKAVSEYEKRNGKIDFLILNGDITNYTCSSNDFDRIYRLSGEITGGNIPVIFSRGNHDTRGIMAEFFEEYMPTDRGRSYFSFRLGDLWGIVLDCGEDKDDSHEEYANTVCCHEFRIEQTKFLEDISKNSLCEYEEKGVNKRIVISHIPFMKAKEENPPFNIESQLYEKWSDILRKSIKPQLAICGHVHELSFEKDNDVNGYPCPVLLGSMPIMIDDAKKQYSFIGAGIVFTDSGIEIECTDSGGNIACEYKIRKKTCTAR